MTTHQVAVLLFDLAVVLLLARLGGGVARRLGQPAVLGELVAGILVGPTLFGGAIAGTLFPVDVRPFLTPLANVGIAVFMFVVGTELDQNLLRGRGKVAATVSAGSILLPFGLGAALASYLAGAHPTGNRLAFVLFMGAAMAVTAFPVLARILTDRDLHRTAVGGLALTCAAVDDVLAWTLLAVVVAVAGAGGGDLWLSLLLLPYLALMFGIVAPLLRWWNGRTSASGAFGVIITGLLLSGAATEWLGLHFVFGAFLFGVVMPRDESSPLLVEVHDRIGPVSAKLLLPVFFVVAALRVDLSGLGSTGLVELGLILLVATGGKFAGAFLAARLHRVSARESATLATLVNTRGLTELVMLGVGLELGLLDAELYSLMVVMAVVTTGMAGPLLRLLEPQKLTGTPLSSATGLDGRQHTTADPR